MRQYVALRVGRALFDVSYAAVNQLLAAATRSLGYRHVHVTSHSLRRGAATELALNGWTLSSIMQAG